MSFFFLELGGERFGFHAIYIYILQVKLKKDAFYVLLDAFLFFYLFFLLDSLSQWTSFFLFFFSNLLDIPNQLN